MAIDPGDVHSSVLRRTNVTLWYCTKCRYDLRLDTKIGSLKYALKTLLYNLGEGADDEEAWPDLAARAGLRVKRECLLRATPSPIP